ncbi:MAG: S9 family peptidase [Pseudomonadota bacterium]
MFRHILPAILLLAAAPAFAQAPPAPGPNRLFTGADLFDLEVASDPQISPDGSRIAYVRRSNDVMTDTARATIWLIDVKSGAQAPLVASPGSHFSPRWSPDGSRLAYVSAGEGNPQLFVRWMATGATARITGLPASPESLAWSPDGSRIAYVMNVPGEGLKLGSAPPKPEGAKWAEPLEVIDRVTYRADGGGYIKPGFDHLFLVPADGGAPRQLTFGNFNDNGPLSWTPDGKTLLFGAVRGDDWERSFDSEIYALDVASGTMKPLTDRRGPDGNPVISPDGTRIAYLGFDDTRRSYENTELYVMNRDGSGARSLTLPLDRSIDDMAWAADGKSLVFQYDHSGINRLARVTVDGRMTPMALTLAPPGGLDRPYSGGAFSMARNGTIAFTRGDALHPADIAVTDPAGARQLTRLNAETLGAKTLAPVTHLDVKAPDGRGIDAWLVTPPNRAANARVPLILEIHGGPHTAYGPSFSTDDQLYAASGYAVLYVNPRGSTSYGEDFANLINKNYPGPDYDDLMAAVDAAIAAGVADPDNLFVTGGSGGGVLTAWIIGKNHRFKGAAAQKPVINWTSEALTMDMTMFTTRYWFEKLPWEDPDSYWKRSPLSLVGNVTTPTLVVVGSSDYRTPVSEAEQYYAALQIRGVPTALVKVPGASHGGIAARPSQAAAKAAAIIAWFDRYRGKPAAP